MATIQVKLELDSDQTKYAFFGGSLKDAEEYYYGRPFVVNRRTGEQAKVIGVSKVEDPE